MSWGPLIHGHAPPALIAQLAKVARLGTSYGAPTELEVEIAEKVRSLVPSIEMVRFASSGTEATMSAVRVARAATGRDRDHQVRRLLPRPRRRLPRQGRLGRADARRADQPRRRGVHRGADADRDVQRSGQRRRAARGQHRAGRGGHRRAGRRQHGHRAAGGRLPRRPAHAVRSARRAADLRRGDDRLPRRTAAAPRRSTACGPT